MAAYDLDTSALVKCYVPELGSRWVVSLMTGRPRNDLSTVRVAGPEAIAALTRKVRTSELTAADAGRARQTFRRSGLPQREGRG